MAMFSIVQKPAALSATVIAGSQSGTAATPLTLAAGASAVDAGVGGRIVGIVSAGDDHLITFAVTGISGIDGSVISESVTGSSGAPGTAVTVNFYSSVSSIIPSGNTASTVTVGTVATTLSTISNMLALDEAQRVPCQVAVEITGTINFSVAETFDPVLTGQGGSAPVAAQSAIRFLPTALASKSANTTAPLDIGATGIAIIINSYSTGATLTARIIMPTNAHTG